MTGSYRRGFIAVTALASLLVGAVPLLMVSASAADSKRADQASGDQLAFCSGHFKFLAERNEKAGRAAKFMKEAATRMERAAKAARATADQVTKGVARGYSSATDLAGRGDIAALDEQQTLCLALALKHPPEDRSPMPQAPASFLVEERELKPLPPYGAFPDLDRMRCSDYFASYYSPTTGRREVRWAIASKRADPAFMAGVEQQGFSEFEKLRVKIDSSKKVPTAQRVLTSDKSTTREVVIRISAEDYKKSVTCIPAPG